MWEFREQNEDLSGQSAVVFALGAVGGLALGMLLSGRLSAPARVKALGGELGRRARGVASRLRPGRLRRAPAEQDELTRLEDAVLEAFLADELLGDRAIDVGAVSRGIVELSGTVWTRDEAALALGVARAVPGVDTVIDRMEVEEERSRRGVAARDYGDASDDTRIAEWQEPTLGMGRRRQGWKTDPPRHDDHSHRQERELKYAAQEDIAAAAAMAAKGRAGEEPEAFGEQPGAVDRDA